MLFDMFAGLGEEYRDYSVIQPQQLPFRKPADESERLTATDIAGETKSNAKALIIIGAVMVALGILALFQSIGGVALIFLGLIPGVLGILMLSKGNSPSLVATGILLKKESHQTGTIHSHTKNSTYWLVIAVEGMEKTLCSVHADSSDFATAKEGDRILVIRNGAVYRGKTIR